MMGCVKFWWGRAINCHLHFAHEGTGHVKLLKLIYAGGEEVGFLIQASHLRRSPVAPTAEHQGELVELRSGKSRHPMPITWLSVTFERPCLFIYDILMISARSKINLSFQLGDEQWCHLLTCISAPPGLSWPLEVLPFPQGPLLGMDGCHVSGAQREGIIAFT